MQGVGGSFFKADKSGTQSGTGMWTALHWTPNLETLKTGMAWVVFLISKNTYSHNSFRRLIAQGAGVRPVRPFWQLFDNLAPKQGKRQTDGTYLCDNTL